MKCFLAIAIYFLSGVAVAQSQNMPISEFFNKATYENMEEVCREFYAEDIKFVDPLGTVEGLPNIVKYYKNLYQNVVSIKFIPINSFEKEGEQVFVWQMHLVHKKVGGGEPIILDGVSVLKYKDGKAVFHRDYFDLGAMIYERVPVLGSIIRMIKEKAHGS